MLRVTAADASILEGRRMRTIYSNTTRIRNQINMSVGEAANWTDE